MLSCHLSSELVEAMSLARPFANWSKRILARDFPRTIHTDWWFQTIWRILISQFIYCITLNRRRSHINSISSSQKGSGWTIPFFHQPDDTFHILRLSKKFAFLSHVEKDRMATWKLQEHIRFSIFVVQLSSCFVKITNQTDNTIYPKMDGPSAMARLVSYSSSGQSQLHGRHRFIWFRTTTAVTCG